MKRYVNRQDPAFREKISDLKRLNNARSLYSAQVYKLLVETMRSNDYKLLSCSTLEMIDSALNLPSREFRFIFVYELEDSGTEVTN